MAGRAAAPAIDGATGLPADIAAAIVSQLPANQRVGISTLTA